MAILKGKIKTETGDILYPETSVDKVVGIDQASVKALYNLGEFDTVDTSNEDYDLITRKTGYLTINTDNIRSTSVNTAPGSGINFVLTDLEIPASDASIPYGDQMGVSSNGYRVLRRSFYWSADLSIGSSATGDADDRSVYIANKSLTTVDQFKALCPIVCQYQLDSAYQHTEKVIKNRPFDTLDQNGSMFVRKEWEKGLNVWKYGSTYTKTASSNTGGDFTVRLISSDGTISNVIYTRSTGSFYGTFTKTSVDHIIRFFISGSAVDVYDDFDIAYLPDGPYIISLVLSGNAYSDVQLSNIMLNEGGHAYPYQSYNGGIVHKKDINGTLLWENGNPNASFTSTGSSNVISIDLTKYDYLILCFKGNNWGDETYRYMKIKCDNANKFSYLFTLATTSSTLTYRVVHLVQNTGIWFEDTGNGVNDYIIPVAIYGTNVL